MKKIYEKCIVFDENYISILAKVDCLKVKLLQCGSTTEYLNFIKKGIYILSLYNGSTRHFISEIDTDGIHLSKEDYSFATFVKTAKAFYPDDKVKMISNFSSFLEISKKVMDT